MVEPEFPEIITNYEIEPGAKYILSFTPNLDWTLSIPEESFKWFKILDGKFEEQSVSGEASRFPVRVTITTASDQSFALRTCKVNLTMGGKTQAIASLAIKSLARVLEVYPAEYDAENGFSYVDGGYIYESNQLTSDNTIELVWDENENAFLFPVNVKSNFEWTATWPEWARADINAESRIGDVPVLMYGVDSQLPYDTTEGVVSFNNGDEQMASFKLVIPGARDKFKFNIGGYTSLKFDHAAYFRADAGTFSKEPIEASIYGPKECRVEVLELTDNGYVHVENSWLDVNVSAWDNVQGAAVLQNRNITVSATRYTENKDRGAIILFLPATAPANTADIFEVGMMQVKAEYAQYAIPVTQLARPSEYFTFDYSIAEREFAGLYFGKSDSDLLPQKNFEFASGAKAWQYDMTYSRTLASTKSAVNLTEPYETVEIYDAQGNIISENLSEHWLNYEQLGDVMYGQVIMVEENLPKVDSTNEDGEPVKVRVEEIDGYVVFKNDQGEVLSIVHCFYVKENLSDVDIYEEASEEVFMDPAAAAAAGVTVYKITAGPTYQQFIEMESPVYLITSTKDDQTFTIKTSKACTIYSCQEDPNHGPKMVTVDNQIFSDPVIAERLDEYEKAKAEYEEARANGTIVDPYREQEPKYPDVSDDRSTMGLLNYGQTIFDSRTYPGYSEIRMKMPQPEEGQAPMSSYKEVILFQTSSATKFVFICNLDLRDAAQSE